MQSQLLPWQGGHDWRSTRRAIDDYYWPRLAGCTLFFCNLSAVLDLSSGCFVDLFVIVILMVLLRVEGVQGGQECGECAVVGLDCCGVDVFMRTVLPISADTEDRGGDASLTEKTRIGGTMFAYDVGSVSFVLGRLPK
jgi:hypothetical protein